MCPFQPSMNVVDCKNHRAPAVWSISGMLLHAAAARLTVCHRSCRQLPGFESLCNISLLKAHKCRDIPFTRHCRIHSETEYKVLDAQIWAMCPHKYTTKVIYIQIHAQRYSLYSQTMGAEHLSIYQFQRIQLLAHPYDWHNVSAQTRLQS